MIVIGIGGSYLGARAAIEFLKSPFYNNMKKDTPDIYYVGNNINPTYLNEVLSICEGKDITVNVISKSGTATSRLSLFGFLKSLLRINTVVTEQKSVFSVQLISQRARLKILRTLRAMKLL